MFKIRIANLNIKIKNLYDGFIYLLHNNKNPLTIERMEKFFYLIYFEKFNSDVLIGLTSKYFYLKDMPLLEKLIEDHLYVYNQLVFLSEEDMIKYKRIARELL